MKRSLVNNSFGIFALSILVRKTWQIFLQLSFKINKIIMILATQKSQLYQGQRHYGSLACVTVVRYNFISLYNPRASFSSHYTPPL